MPRSLTIAAALILFAGLASAEFASAAPLSVSPNSSPISNKAAGSAAASFALVTGVVSDSTGAIIPGAEVDLLDSTGAIAVTVRANDQGGFQVTAPKAGSYMLVITAPGFDAVQEPVAIAVPSSTAAATATMPASANTELHVVLPLAAVATNVQVTADSSRDLTATDTNSDSSVMSAKEMKSLPIFDNDFATAMSAFLDSSAAATGGSGLLVDGVEANRVTVSASAVQEIRINQDPYSAQYYWPGRGQMEIITKSAADKYHGQFNFYFRDSAMNATNALASTKPPEQRRIYEGSVLGPIPHARNSSFLVSFNRAEENLDAYVYAPVASTPSNPSGIFTANVPAPTRDTEFSIRAGHQFGEKHSAYVQYAYKDWNAQNQGAGGQTLQPAGYSNHYREDDFISHVDSTLSLSMLNQLSFVLEHDYTRNQNVTEAPQMVVEGNYTTGSAQNDVFNNEYNGRLTDMLTWTRGKHLIKMGVGVPHFNRRVLEDNTNSAGTYTFSPTLDASGNVAATSLDNYADNHPSAFTQNAGQSRFIYHQQEAGAFVQDQIRLSARLSVTPGLRYDWQNFLANNRTAFSPRLSFAYVLNQDSETVLRGGGGVYYDRFGSSPMADLVRYQNAARRALVLSLDPLSEPESGCVPITNCISLSEQPPSIVQLAPNITTPYQIQYGLSIERKVGEHGELSVSGYSMRELHAFRSVDINAPTPASDYTERPDDAYGRIRQMQAEGFTEGNGLDVQYRGRYNRYFSGFARYSWSHYASNQNGISWFPQNQYNPNDEWADASWDHRNRLGFYGMFNSESLLNLAVGFFANSGSPWTILTGTDPYGDDLYNARPEGVSRDTEIGPDYVDLDLRWGHDFALTANKQEESPHIGLSAGAFNVLNHENGNSVDQIETSSTFSQITSANSPRRIQLGMRFEF